MLRSVLPALIVSMFALSTGCKGDTAATAPPAPAVAPAAPASPVASASPTTSASSTSSAPGPSADHAPAGYVPGTWEDWCGGHGVPESVCTRCSPKLIPAFKATGDWCAEHGLPESQCLKCNPDLAIVRPPKPATPGPGTQ